MRPAAASIRIVRDRSLHRTALPGAHCAGVRSAPPRRRDGWSPAAATDLPSGQDQRATSISPLAKDIVLSLLGLVAGKAGGFGIRTHHPIAGVTTSATSAAVYRIPCLILCLAYVQCKTWHGGPLPRCSRASERREAASLPRVQFGCVSDLLRDRIDGVSGFAWYEKF